MKNAVITSCDAHCGHFFADHWLRSLKNNVDISNIYVVLLDYGLTEEQISKITGVKVYKANKKFRISNIRFRDIKALLEKKNYDQVMLADGGDSIFQTGIKEIFEYHTNDLRAAVEDYYIDFKHFYMKGAFENELTKKIYRALQSKKMINAGVIIGPSKKVKQLCNNVYEMVLNKNAFGPDQIALNYLLHTDGFKELDNKYNFIPATNKRNFTIRNGIFYFDNGEKPPHSSQRRV